MNVKPLRNKKVVNLIRDFKKQDNEIIGQVKNHDVNATPLALSTNKDGDVKKQALQTTQGTLQKSKSKALYGRYANQIAHELVDQDMTLTFLTKGYLHRKTSLPPLKDEVIRTKNCEKQYLKMNNHDKCRKCNKARETIKHITSCCPTLLFWKKH